MTCALGYFADMYVYILLTAWATTQNTMLAALGNKKI